MPSTKVYFVNLDVNKITTRPSVQLPDFDGTDADHLVAKQFWDAHKQRNDSIVVDLFQGQYKSKITCAKCSSTVVKFEPFMQISLELPQVPLVVEVLVVLVDQQIFKCRVKALLSMRIEEIQKKVVGELSQQANFCGFGSSTGIMPMLINKQTRTMDLVREDSLISDAIKTSTCLVLYIILIQGRVQSRFLIPMCRARSSEQGSAATRSGSFWDPHVH
jgi:hypothetical protein